jgi:protein-S-isoprenylcysteine O-methyltransferase Ste14
MKNYSEEGQKLPLFGVGPWLIGGITLFDAVVLYFVSHVYKIGIIEGVWAWIFRILGIILSVLGIAIWYTGSILSGMDENIRDNKLKTDGIYAWVRNPMYTGFWFAITGITFLWSNLFMLLTFLIGWTIITVVLINTEEKWLLDVYGNEYAEYKKRVNRCFPWKRG